MLDCTWDVKTLKHLNKSKYRSTIHLSLTIYSNVAVQVSKLIAFIKRTKKLQFKCRKNTSLTLYSYSIISKIYSQYITCFALLWCTWFSALTWTGLFRFSSRSKVQRASCQSAASFRNPTARGNITSASTRERRTCLNSMLKISVTSHQSSLRLAFCNHRSVSSTRCRTSYSRCIISCSHG